MEVAEGVIQEQQKRIKFLEELISNSSLSRHYEEILPQSELDKRQALSLKSNLGFKYGDSVKG